MSKARHISNSVSEYSISSNATLSANKKYFVDTASALSLTLPASPSVGDQIQILDKSNSAESNNITVLSNSLKINGEVQDAVIDVNSGGVIFIYTGSTYGWRMA